MTTATTDPGSPRPPKAIDAVDLTDDAAARPLWRRRAAGSAAVPGPGWGSPLGYWLSVAGEGGGRAGTALRVEFRAPGAVAAVEGAPARPAGSLARPAQTVRLKAPDAAAGDLTLLVASDGAQVAASPEAWDSLAEPVLLAVCQYWRFASLDARLDRLTEQIEAHNGVGRAPVPPARPTRGRGRGRGRGRMLANARELGALLLDLPHFMEPLTDPYPFCSSDRSVQVYRSLVEKLHLEAWCEAIDDRAEAVEEAYAVAVAELVEYRNFAWNAVLEVAIVLILLADLFFQIWQHLAGV